MEEISGSINRIIEKLNKGVKFGLFDTNSKCCFRDGEQYSYTDLWAAVKIMFKLEPGHSKTLPQLLPGVYVGSFSHKASKHKWK